MRRLPRRILIPAALLAFGAAAIALALAVDLLGVGEVGFGAEQRTLLAMGVASLVVGLLSGLGLMTPAGRAYVTGWRQQMRAATAPAGILLVAIWFGLLTGWGQALVFLIRKEIQGQLILMGIDYGWMIPLANLVFFLVLGLALALLHRRWPRLVSTHTATFLLAWLGTLGLVLMIRHVSSLALLVLAAGIAMQLARLATRHNRGFSTLVRFSVGWPALLRRPREAESPSPSAAASAPLPGAVALSPTRRQFLLGVTSGIAAVALGTQAGLAVTERRALTRLVRPASRMPNVLLVVLDTVRARSMSLCGYSRPTTPNLERIAAQGTLFTHAIAPSSWTLPSHASMFTGRLPYELATDRWTPLDARHPTLAEILSAHGYETAGFSANSYYCSREFGLSRGFAHYEDYRITPGQAFGYTSLGNAAVKYLQFDKRFGTYRNFGRKSAEQVNHDFLRWLSGKARQPFFAFLNYFDAHDPYLPPAAFGLRFAAHTPRGFLVDGFASDLKGEELRELRDAYDGSIAYLDHELGALFNALGALNLLDDTVVAITSDHGEQFGEHDLLNHGNSLYCPLIHVPLLLLGPGQIPAGMAVHEPVGLTDLLATFVDLTGVPRAADLPGCSIARCWNAPMAQRDAVAYSDVDIHWPVGKASLPVGRYRSLVSSEYHYILRPDGKEELYGIEADPDEVTDLAETPGGRDAIQRLRALLPPA